jgi:hypothetical protein
MYARQQLIREHPLRIQHAARDNRSLGLHCTSAACAGRAAECAQHCSADTMPRSMTVPHGIPCRAGYQAVEAERYLPAPRGRPRSRIPSRLSVRAPSTFPSRRANWCAAAGVSASWRSWYRTGDRGGAGYTVRHGMTMGGAKRSAAELCQRDVPVVQHATRNMQHTTCRSMQHAAYNMQHATCNMQHATCNMQHAACRMQHAACSMQLRTRSLST